jgi:hypothetical protein
MAIPSFFRQTKPRGFNYVPRYYDPQKDEWEQKRMARSMERGEVGSEPGAQGTENKPYRSKIMRGSMKNYFPRNRERVQRQSMIRFIVILIILVFVIYIYLRY